MADLLHLVRHGEVLNPEALVYGRLQGFDLSESGRDQADAAAAYLAARPLVAVYSSPLERARQTAEPIAARHDLTVEAVADLIEWGLGARWEGVSWRELEERFPGELQDYLERPHALAFSPESLQDLALRVSRVLERLHRVHPKGEVVAVGHQDPLQAARLALTGRPLHRLHDDKLGHAAVVTLRPGTPWEEVMRWAPSRKPVDLPKYPGTEEGG